MLNYILYILWVMFNSIDIIILCIIFNHIILNKYYEL